MYNCNFDWKSLDVISNMDDVSILKHDICSKKVNFHHRINQQLYSFTREDCDNILQIQGMQQSITNQLHYLPEMLGDIKITIKDRSILRVDQQNTVVIKRIINSWLKYTTEQKKLRLFKKIIEQNINKIYLKYYFHEWRQLVIDKKILSIKKKDESKLEDLRKVEAFVDTINKQQLRLKCRNKKDHSNSNNLCRDTEFTFNNEAEKNNSFMNTIESRLFKDRLSAKQKIIAEQRMMLAKQNRVIEDMKLKQIQAETKLAEIEMLQVANASFSSNDRLKKNFKQLIKGKKDDKTNICGFRNSGESVPKTPDFLIRMEARAAERREQIRKRDEERRRKLAEKQKIELAMKINEEEKRKRIMREAKEEAKRIIEQKAKEKIWRLEKVKINNQLADNFYSRYLLYWYGIKPLKKLLDMKKNSMSIALAYWNKCVLKKIFIAWRYQAKKQIYEKLNLYRKIYEQQLMEKIMFQWKEWAHNKMNKRQYIANYYHSRLKRNFFNQWFAVTLSARIIYNNNSEKAVSFYGTTILKKYFKLWRRYLQVLDKIKDSDKRKNEFRQLVLTVIPDFAPSIRGVHIDE